MAGMTIKDIAKKCGVGVSTVSRAMNDHPDINQETKDKILRVIAESNYIPNNSARNLKRSEAKAIAVLVKGLGNTFFGELVSVLERECEKKGYSCILQHVEEQDDELDVALYVAKEKKPRGMIFLGGNFSHPKEKIEQLGIPCVLSTICTYGDQEQSYGTVSVDDFQESRKMTEYLLGLGHERIALLTAPRESEDRYSFATGYRLAKKLLDQGERFTALYATSDTLAIGACRALKEAGIDIPGDCSVAGFDGMEMGAYYIPSLTTIRQPVEQIAKASAGLLFNMIKGKEKPGKLIYEGQLLIRESTAKRKNM